MSGPTRERPAREVGVTTPEGARDTPSVVTVVGTELSRLGRKFPLWLTFGLPLALVVPHGLIAVLSPEGRQGHVWEVWLQIVLMFWGVFLPMAAALYAAVSVRQDDEARRLLYSYAFPRSRLLLGKYFALAAMGLLSAVLLTCFLSLLAVVFGESGDLARVVASGMVPWLASLGTLALCLVMANMWGFTATVCTGVAGMMFGALLADKVVWWLIPLAWPMRVVVPLAGIEASGVPLPADHPLNDMGVLPIAVGLSLTLAAVLLAVGSRYVNREEL